MKNGDASDRSSTENQNSSDNIQDKPITFDARRFHQVEPHEGHLSAMAAYTPQTYNGFHMKCKQSFIFAIPCSFIKMN